MSSFTISEGQIEIEQFVQASLRAILRGEAEERVPPRFSSKGEALWNTFRNELTVADLTALAIQDIGVTMPIPFDPGRWWPGWPDWELLKLPPPDVEKWLAEALLHAEVDRDDYVQTQAAMLGIEIPSNDSVTGLPTPQQHERYIELPGTGGCLSYALCARADANLYYWENFTIVCRTPQETLFAGLIAWELGAPPRIELPIRLDDPDLTATLKAGETYHGVMARRDLHGHRDLRILQRNGEPSLWL